MMGAVRSYMTTTVKTLTQEDTVYDAVLMEMGSRIRHIPVVEGQSLVGIVTDRDLKRAMPSVATGTNREDYERALSTIRIGQIMTKSPHTVTPDTSIEEVVRIFCEKKYGALPVIEGKNTLVGIITQIDILRGLLAIMQNDTRNQGENTQDCILA